MHDIDVFWSFRSPYSYLATPGMLELARDYPVAVNLRVVLPIAIRAPDTLFTPENAGRARYILLDWQRRAEFLGMPHVWPSPDPVVQDLETMQIATAQPHIHRLSALGVEAQRRQRGIEFAAQVSALLFGGTVGWDQGDHLAQATQRAGLDLADMESAISNGNHAAEIEENHQRLEAAGHWGVPTFVFNDEPFFGQDRIDTLRWRLEQQDLRKE